MRLVTWNVNSLRARLGRVEEWIVANEPDVLAMQETKCTEANFPTADFKRLGYETVHHGTNQWNGVAIASRLGLEDARRGFSDEAPGAPEESRLVSARCGGLNVLSVYVPNGRVVNSEHYVAKLAWLGHLRAELAARFSASQPLAVCGDFNVAPEDRDVWDVDAFAGETHVTPAERAALGEVISFGLEDALRAHRPDEVGPFSWWDYRAGAFHKGWGMRIDLALLSAPVMARVEGAYVDREARKGKLPSDHAPVVIDLSD